MGADFLNGIDWQRPWLMPLLPQAQHILQSSDWRAALNDAAASLKNHRGLPIQFVPQSDLPPKIPYEAFISDTGQVPTRDNLHDFFNAIVWLTYPKIKAKLNALQATEISKATNVKADDSPNRSRRGKLRDAATIFDESAALLIVRDTELIDMLRDHRWEDVFMTKRAAFGRDCEVRLFGHALMEKLVSPYKAITAHARAVTEGGEFFSLEQEEEKRAWIDAKLDCGLHKGLATSDFMPLPILGVPGWCEGQDDAFYDDTKVFRPKRRSNL